MLKGGRGPYRLKGILQNWKSPRPGPGQNAVLVWSLEFTAVNTGNLSLLAISNQIV